MSGTEHLPLHGVRVFEFCEVAAGPFCGLLLADIGAEVIKVERHGAGDAMRQWPPLSNGYSENFASLNRNKQSICVDVKDPAARDRLFELIATTGDVVIENYRPGVMEGNGFGYEALSERNPKLVYCSLSAFGQTGPRRGEGGFDVTIQAMSGIMSITGEPGGSSVKAGVPVSDFGTGLYGGFSVVSALLAARARGKGAYIDISMLGASLAMCALQTSEFFGTGNEPRKLGSAHPRNAPYRAFKAADVEFVLAAGNNKLWASVCQTVERPDLLDDPRFKSTLDRATNQEELKAILEPIFGTRPASEWIAAFSRVGVPSAPINTVGAALGDVQTVHLGLVQPVTLPGGRETHTVISPIRIDGVNLPLRHAPPELGSATASVTGV